MGHKLDADLDGKGVRVALVVSRFNDFVTSKLLSGAEDCLAQHGSTESDRTVIRVPGAWEIPLAAKKLTDRGGYDVIVALGALIRGETPHFDVLASQVAAGLGQIGLDSGVPVIFGVLTTDTVDQAIERSGSKSGNKGWEAALSALEMVHLYRGLG